MPKPVLTSRSWEQLKILFQKSRAPKSLAGFYRGRLLKTQINPVTDFFMLLVRRYFMPWKGKFFTAKKRTGVNVVSKKAAFLFRFQHPLQQIKNNQHTIEVFPFKTSLKKSPRDRNKTVFLIDYNIAANPSGVRRVVDELVTVSREFYLGRALLKEGRKYRTVAYFSLQKDKRVSS